MRVGFMSLLQAMKISLLTPRFTLAVLALLLCTLAAARAQTVITSLPYTITASGLYVLNNNLNGSQTSGSLITINASNVTIDFQNHYIAGAVGNTAQTTFGVYANERSNLTIKNGTIAYCNKGIELDGNGSATTNSVNHQIENMRVTYCYYLGIQISAGPGSRVANCQISQTGFSGAGSAFGIFITGDGVTVQSNVVSIVTASGNGSLALYTTGNDFFRQNTISNAYYGVVGGKYQDNLTSGCTTAYTGGTDAGGNN